MITPTAKLVGRWHSVDDEGNVNRKLIHEDGKVTDVDEECEMMQLVPDVVTKKKNRFLFKDMDGKWIANVLFSQIGLHGAKLQFFGDERNADKAIVYLRVSSETSMASQLVKQHSPLDRL